MNITPEMEELIEKMADKYYHPVSERKIDFFEGIRKLLSNPQLMELWAKENGYVKKEEQSKQVGFRVGRSRKRSVLNYDGTLLVMFEEGQEEYAQKFCDYLNLPTPPKQ